MEIPLAKIGLQENNLDTNKEVKKKRGRKKKQKSLDLCIPCLNQMSYLNEQKNKDNIIMKLIKAFFYNEERTQLSRTAMINFTFFAMTIAAFITGILAYLISNKEIPNNIYLFVGTLTGGGFLQYSFSKHLNSKKETNGEEKSEGNKDMP